MEKKIKKYEFTSRYFGAHEIRHPHIKEIQHMGEDGWQLVSVTHNNFVDTPQFPCNYTFYFQREK
jgi:predicted nucleic-acid-binding Zn-ribbon protein